MKKIAIMTAIAVVATTSFGLINVSWRDYGFVSSSSTDAENPVYAMTDGVKLVWDLVWTSGGSAVAPDVEVEKGEVVDFKYGATEEVLSRRVWDGTGNQMTVTDRPYSESPVSKSPLTMDLDFACIDTGDYTFADSSYAKNSGGIYAIVFQYMADKSVFYAVTDLVTDLNWDDAKKLPDEVSFGWDKDAQELTTDVKIGTNLYRAVPEPATMSLLGLGALAMVVRRKLRK